MFHRYRYEAEFYPALSRLPLDVRRKLDIAGIKLALKDWLAFSFEERMVLCHLPCDGDEESQVFINYLDFLSRKYRGAPIESIERLDAARWSPAALPQAVGERSAALNLPVALEQWRCWESHERYALYKTAVSKNQPEAFEQVLAQLLGSRDDC
ncbi:MAG TPA: nitrate reductase associated protein [Acidobacteriota bacterium]|nr:nitrate reductase associated protein [Acidobacteriota bacterium]